MLVVLNTQIALRGNNGEMRIYSLTDQAEAASGFTLTKPIIQEKLELGQIRVQEHFGQVQKNLLIALSVMTLLLAVVGGAFLTVWVLLGLALATLFLWLVSKVRMKIPYKQLFFEVAYLYALPYALLTLAQYLLFWERSDIGNIKRLVIGLLLIILLYRHHHSAKVTVQPQA